MHVEISGTSSPYFCIKSQSSKVRSFSGSLDIQARLLTPDNKNFYLAALAGLNVRYSITWKSEYDETTSCLTFHFLHFFIRDMTVENRGAGWAPIKAEYIVPKSDAQIVQNEPKDASKEAADQQKEQGEKKYVRGQNKKRQFQFNDSSEYYLCHFVSVGLKCEKSGCKSGHDLDEYLKTRPESLGDACPNFEAAGFCRFGLRCRFYKAHTTEDGQQILKGTAQGREISSLLADGNSIISYDTMVSLRKRKYEFPRTTAALKRDTPSPNGTKENENTVTAEPIQPDGPEKEADLGPIDTERVKKTIDFKGKTYLAPLTTVGNLPFRRVCKDLGVDITCGEMAMSNCILQGQPSEWALMRRHPSEDLFGVQICGKHADQLGRCVELINNEIDCDFIDLNMGCPIDLVFNQGSGSGLLARPKRMYSAIKTMVDVSTVPVTLKFRSGIENDKNIAHTHLPEFKRLGVALCTLHGRSRQQRYSKYANYEYIGECANIARDLDMPFFGNGDVLSFEDYYRRLDTTSVDGLMIGRAALIKPWIFTEIKERRYWDITPTERLDLMQKFVNYGLNHWGSDTQGVNKVRRYFLEWHSFMYRYVPVGLLEVLPPKMNDRPPKYYGRSEMETLLASDNVNDWIKISEMFLGKANEDFQFVPKHKSNSYST